MLTEMVQLSSQVLCSWAKFVSVREFKCADVIFETTIESSKSTDTGIHSLVQMVLRMGLVLAIFGASQASHMSMIPDIANVLIIEICIAWHISFVCSFSDSWWLLISARNTESFGDGIS